MGANAAAALREINSFILDSSLQKLCHSREGGNLLCNSRSRKWVRLRFQLASSFCIQNN